MSETATTKLDLLDVERAFEWLLDSVPEKKTIWNKRRKTISDWRFCFSPPEGIGQRKLCFTPRDLPHYANYISIYTSKIADYAIDGYKPDLDYPVYFHQLDQEMAESLLCAADGFKFYVPWAWDWVEVQDVEELLVKWAAAGCPGKKKNEKWKTL